MNDFVKQCCNKKYKALFLDRDGVINKDFGHVGSIDRFEIIPEIFTLTKLAQSLNYLIIVITNQAGIAKGYYTIDEFIELTLYKIQIFKKQGINNIKTYFCPYHKQAICNNYIINEELQKEKFPSKQEIIVRENIYLSQYRKPNPCMILQASLRFNIDLQSSIFIGDKITDIEASSAAGIKKTYMCNSINDFNFLKLLN